jgi:hypothetical protein
MGDERVRRERLGRGVRCLQGAWLFLDLVLQEVLPKGGGVHRLELELWKVLGSIWMVSTFCIHLSLFETVKLRAKSGFDDLGLGFIQRILQRGFYFNVSLSFLLCDRLSQWRKPRGSPPLLIRLYSHLR